MMLADGDEAIADLAVLRDQGEVFGPVAFTPTARRLLAAVDETVLDRLRPARASARETARLQAAEYGGGIPAVRAGGRELPGLVPLLCFLANTAEALTGQLRPGNA
ncbi:hypothetical protein ACIBBE_44705 [Streptomyces sp. NPDC051644]|uniref:hypothetical protein n=1 Tax=Streptomyces sp. NPDC051644 TaxID=3365666 RepID=UPI0037881F62